MNLRWKRGEFWYCRQLVTSRGDKLVGVDPKTIASYLRLQASSAFDAAEMEISARLSVAATRVNEDARNSHEPNWEGALEVLTIPGVETGSLEDRGGCEPPARDNRVRRAAPRAQRRTPAPRQR
ncbi:MAG: hypothetical protein KGL39_03155 [Patescibacteria group bacterium]|nr:hypothetical protein [Patescibacteria group bacterium]